MHVLPHIYDSEGFFVAQFKKLDSTDHENVNKKRSNFRFNHAVKKTLNHLTMRLNLGTEYAFLKNLMMYERDSEIWVFPKQYFDVMERFKFQRCGVKLLKSIVMALLNS